MTYHLLTGATGLLGSYLIREFLRQERPLAVVVRPTNRESARQRIENIVVRWEKEFGYFLPRPVVLDGDICQENLGLDDRARRWVTENCQSMLHNAASMTFQPDDRRGEPHRTNVEGTRNVLEFCRAAGIRQFHHVSTAFICGLRTGRILESEIDLGQQYGNVYEKSKITGEKMVRAAEFLDPPTIYRPATIVGDSRNGYTTTYHGVYAPLKLVWAIADKIDFSQNWGQGILELLGLNGKERKNLVPVDWVASIIAYIHAHPEHHGKAYHLAPRNPVTVSAITEVMEETLRDEVKQPDRKAERAPDEPELDLFSFGEAFRTQLDVYKSHWRDDPEFDITNTLAAAPHLPSPTVDRAMLRRISTFALRANFGWPKPQPVKPEFDVQEHMGQLLQNSNGAFDKAGPGRVLGLQVNGPGGGQWELLVDDGRPVGARQGITAGSPVRFYLNTKTFQRLAAGRITAGQAISAGQVLLEGSGTIPESSKRSSNR